MAKQKFNREKTHVNIGTLKQWRRIRGLSQKQLGDLVGVTRQTVMVWENDGIPTNADTIAKLEKALDINWRDVVSVQ